MKTLDNLNPLRGLRVYLASPYSSDVPGLQEWRAQRTARAMITLLSNGIFAYAPVPHGHYAERVSGLSAPVIHYSHWLAHGLMMLRGFEVLAVLKLPEWERSMGVVQERKLADELSLPVFGLPPDLLFAGTPAQAPFDPRGSLAAEARVAERRKAEAGAQMERASHFPPFMRDK